IKSMSGITLNTQVSLAHAVAHLGERAVHTFPRIACGVAGGIPRQILRTAMAFPVPAELLLDFLKRSSAAARQRVAAIAFPAVLIRRGITLVGFVLVGVGAVAVVLPPVGVFCFGLDAQLDGHSGRGTDESAQ